MMSILVYTVGDSINLGGRKIFPGILNIAIRQDMLIQIIERDKLFGFGISMGSAVSHVIFKLLSSD